MRLLKYISNSIDKFKKDALAKTIYDVVKVLLIAFLTTSGISIAAIWLHFLDFIFYPITTNVFALILIIVSTSLFTALLVNQRFRRKYDALKMDNHTDELTGLKNNKALKEDLTISISSSKDHPLSLILIDVDNFKSFNDKTSHEIADELIKKLGELLASDKRATDETYRYHQAGDEFIIVARKTNIAQAKQAAERKRKLIEDNVFEVEGRYHTITVSCGYVELKPSEAYSSVTDRVSKAMLQAKQSGKNCSKSLN